MKSETRLVDALWRAITYVSVVQLHLEDNVLLDEPLLPSHVKARPSGHWGTVPGCAWWLAHLALVDADPRTTPAQEILPVIGPGHAGIVQLAYSWLTGALGQARPMFPPSADGLRALARSFPEVEGLGAEVSPLLPAGLYLGGQLGGALGFAQGVALDAPGRAVVALLGDGECETPTTAAAWLAALALPGPCAVLPVVHLNGYRMGGPTLLTTFSDDGLAAYAAGLGWSATVTTVHNGTPEEHGGFRAALLHSLAAVVRGERVALFLRCVKGWGGPMSLDGRPLVGRTPMHKTPLSAARTDREQLAALSSWLMSYRPHGLFDASGAPRGALAEALEAARSFGRRFRPAPQPAPSVSRTSSPRSFGEAVCSVLRRHAATPGFRVFSPDEAASNRLEEICHEPFLTEVLAEEVLLAWLAGWVASGRRGLLVSYEAFAPLLMTGLAQHLKHRRLARPDRMWPSLNVLLTSYGWHNCFTHGDPSLTTALLAGQDPAVRVYTPADPARLAAVLDETLCSDDRVNLVVAGKHASVVHPLGPMEEELHRGLAIWPHLSDPGEADLTVVAAGDLPANVLTAAVPLIRRQLGRPVRVIAVSELTVLGDPARWPRGLTDQEIDYFFGRRAPALVATLGHPAAVHGLIAGRWRRPVQVMGWRELDRPMAQEELAAHIGLDAAGMLAAAVALVKEQATTL